MTKREFQRICGLKNSDHTLLLSYREYRLTGKLVDCWDENFLVDINGKLTLWPKDLCDGVKTDYPIPSYS